MDWTAARAVFLGDSITQGIGCGGSSAAYPALVSARLRLREGVNAGLCSSCVGLCRETAVPSFLERLDALPTDAELVTVLGGSNDYFRGIPLGKRGDSSAYTFFGAYAQMIGRLKDRFPRAALLLMTPPHNAEEAADPREGGRRMADYAAAVRTLAGLHGLPLIDLYEESGLCPADPENRARYCPDGTHPNDAGQRLLADAVVAGLKRQDWGTSGPMGRMRLGGVSGF